MTEWINTFTGLHPTVITTVGWLVAVIIAVSGWLYNAHRQRLLQRKQLAVMLLSQNRFKQPWVDGLKAIFEIICNDPKYDWKRLAEKRFGHERIEGSDLDIYEHLKTVLNYLEFIAIAVLNKAADEDIIRWSLEAHYIKLNKVLHSFFEATTQLSGFDGAFCNFRNLANKWTEKPQIAKPTR